MTEQGVDEEHLLFLHRRDEVCVEQLRTCLEMALRVMRGTLAPSGIQPAEGPRSSRGPSLSAGLALDQAASSSAGVSSTGPSSVRTVAAAPGSIMIALTIAASAARAART